MVCMLNLYLILSLLILWDVIFVLKIIENVNEKLRFIRICIWVRYFRLKIYFKIKESFKYFKV